MILHTQYIIISTALENQLVETVNDFIILGWECQGSLILQFPAVNGKAYFQPMIKPYVSEKQNTGPR